MKDVLLKFLSAFPELKKEEIEVIAEHIPVEAYKKGTVLVKEGEIPSKCYFVLKGCVRQYYVIEGEEKTTAFFTEEYGAVSSSHYTNQTPSDHYLSCLEDCILISGDANIDVENYQKFPVLENITRAMMEEELNETKENFAKFVTSSPEQRYLNLIETRPELINRVPQHMIASYLGMKPESLSRIRKRIVSKSKNKS